MGKDEDFVLSKVFSTLSNVDLLRASSVCKNWFNICLDPMFEWAKILTCSGESPDAKLQCESRVKQIVKLDAISYIVEDIRGKLGGLTVNPVSGCVFDWCVEAADLADIYPMLWKCTVSAVPSSKGTKVCVTASLNIKEFHRIKEMEEEGREESETILANCLQWKADRILTLNHWGVVKPQNFYGDVLKKVETPIGVQLYDYQHEALSWMLSIEDKNANNKKFRGLELDCIRVPHQHPILYSRRYQRFVEIQDALPYLPFLSPKGGFLLDDYGLGKSMEILSLILSNPIPFSQVTRKFKVASFGEIPQVSTFLYASKATLILCPSLVVHQWRREISQRTTTSFKVVTLDTVKDISQCVYADIQAADVIIASFSLVCNPSYAFTGLEYLQSPPSQRASAVNINPFVLQDSSLRTAHLSRLLSGLKKESEMGLNHKNPILELFYFHRIVIDEAHMLSDEKLLKAIGLLTATNWWVASSTPVDPSSTRLKLASYMGLVEGMDKRYCDSMLHDYFIWRNTRYSNEVASKYLPEVNTQVVLIPKFLNETERLMYEMMDVKAEKHQDLFCSTPFQKKASESLTQWHNSVVVDLFDELIRSLSYIKKNETATEKLKKKQQKLSLTLTSNYLSPTDRKTTERRNSLAAEQREKHEKMVVHYGAVFSEIMWKYSVLCSAKKDTVAEFSTYNILEPVNDRAVRKTNSNPIPRKKSRTKMIIQQMEEEILQKYNASNLSFRGTPNDLMLHLANIYGTKLTYFMIHLRNIWAQDPNAKVTIFSQHTEALETVSTYLKKSGIASVTITENSQQNGEKLESFVDSDQLRVLLSDYSAKNTGITLTGCSNIIFLDPINSKNRIQALEMERLAISRVQRIGQPNKINLVKFIISDSIEHELFLAIHPEHNSRCNKRNSIPQLPTTVASPNTFLESQSHLKELVEKYNSPKRERRFLPAVGTAAS